MESKQVHIPEGWVQYSISDLCNIGRGRVISQKEIRSNVGEFPVYSSQTENDGQMGKISTFDFEGEYVTWTTDGANAGTVFFRSGKFNCTNVCGTLKEKVDQLDLQFLAYKLSTVAKLHVSYIGNPKLMNGTMSKIVLDIPELKPEQTQIASILSKVDEAITQTQQLIAKYSRIKTGLMQDLLTKGIDENGNIRSEDTHEFKDSPLGRIPKEWDCEMLGENNIVLHNNKRKPISAKLRSNMIGDYPYYGATGIIDHLNEYRIEGEFVLFGEDGDHFLKWVFQEQTILVNGRFNVSNHAHIVEGTPKCSTQWIHYFFCHRDITFYLTRQGAGRFKLNKASLLSLPILIPNSPEEQERLIQRIEKVNEYSDNLNSRLLKLQSLKTGLMQDLLSGKVRVNHLIKETASV